MARRAGNDSSEYCLLAIQGAIDGGCELTGTYSYTVRVRKFITNTSGIAVPHEFPARTVAREMTTMQDFPMR